MKLNLSHLLAVVTFILTISAVSSASAQDGAPVNEYPELSPLQDPTVKEDKPLLYEPEGKSTQKEQTVNTTTSSSKPKAKTAEQTKTTASKNEEDALSFNFLYYIIQKFKASDIVDQ
jgi:flagellar motor protein MotB